MTARSRFFEEFSQRHHNRQAAVWSQPFPAPVSREEFFAACAGYQATANTRERNHFVELTFNDDLLGISDTALWPHPGDSDFAGYAGRLSRESGAQTFFAYFTNLEDASPELWLAAKSLLRSLCVHTGGFPQRSFLTGFVSNTPVTPFGVHTDSHSIFTFILEGR